jgi:two-component system, chemotaxis family, protein-glutamate methylesterase/glutaminase
MVASLKTRVKVVSADSRIRVLVVDDSVVIRRLVTHALAEDDQLEVAGAAPNGVIALQRIPQLKPDVITLDVEMPEMDGLETLRQIRKLYPELPVIMFSTLTERGATATLDALSLGASDYVTKAANVGSLEKSMVSLRSELVPKIKQFFQFGTAAKHSQPVPLTLPVVAAPVRVRMQPATMTAERRVVAIGVSTGGPDALAQVMPMFPKDFRLPIVIVQHMPPLFTRLLAERLNAISAIRVEEVKEGSCLEPGKALLAAGGYHMRVRKKGAGVIATMDEEPPENSCRPAVDVLFRSVGEVYSGGSIAVILTGMGYDGLRVAGILKEMGAYVIAQDERSSVVWGMPGAVAKSGLADATVDLACVVPEILKQI